MYVPFGKPPLSVKYAVLKQPLAPPEFTCPIDWPFIRTVTVPPQTVIPYRSHRDRKVYRLPIRESWDEGAI